MTQSTRRQIVQRLKQAGPLEAATLADQLQMTAMAIRQHLYALHDEGLVSYREVSKGRGRPAKYWHLTEAANQYFPEAYAELTLDLITTLTTVFGAEGLAKVLDVRTAQQIASYQAQLAPITELAPKIAVLAQLRTQEGYMASTEAQADGSWLLIEKHCPICVAAQACTGLCDRELAVFQAVLPAQVERVEHLLAGAYRCAYRVTPHTSSQGTGSKTDAD